MPKSPLLVPAAALAVVVLCGPASAEALRCWSVNGNVSCAGPGAASCQSVDGRTVCVGGRGDTVQVFGNGDPWPDPPKWTGDDDTAEDDGAAADEAAVPLVPPPPWRFLVERRDRDGGRLLLRREGRSLHLRTDRLSLDID